MGLEQDQSLEGEIKGWNTRVALFGGGHGVVGSPRSFSFLDAGKGPSGKLSPEGLFYVTAKNFLV